MDKPYNNHRDIKFLHREYASFRPNIVRYFKDNVLPNSEVILDPMSGTAPLIPYVESQHLTAFFYDILPIYYYINIAKTYKVYKAVFKANIKIIEKELIKILKSVKNKKLIISENWISDDILDGLLNAWYLSGKYEKQVSIFFKALIIMCIRPLSCTTSSSKNTTWYKSGGMTSEKDLNIIIHENIMKYEHYFQIHYNKSKLNKGGKIEFKTCDAKLIKNLKHVDTIITSPPYANRYDYVIMYAPELYFLSKVDKKITIENLRKTILASNSVKDFLLENNDMSFIKDQSPKTTNFLLKVKQKGKDNENYYYLRCFMKYYINLFKILDNLLNILIEKGRLYIVVQDNIHRGELNKVADFIIDYLKHKGLNPSIVYRELHKHQGTRNISADYPLVLKKHTERIIEVIK